MSSAGTVMEHHENCQVRNYAGIPGSVCTCGLNISEQPTEMKSLRDIKDKLDETRKGILELTDAIKAAFKGQRAALDGLNAGIARELGELRKEWAIGYRYLREEIAALRRELAKPPRKRAAKRRRK
jgi:hypothetical protein